MADSITATGSSFAARLIKYWLPVAAMIGLMYFFSTDSLSGENTRGLIEQIMGWLLSGVSDRTAARINFVIRKSAHFIEYAILAGLLYRAFRADNIPRWRLRWAVYSFAIIFIWALLDEYHQAFTSKRSGSIYDSLLDMAGGLFALLVIAWFNYGKTSSSGQKP
ncbi:MAG TPA: VanZ family protein [Blastocatellia bacterium]|nr:VanZ family protein [Blastocatellia bacterium]